MPKIVVDRRLWLDADGRVVEDGDPAAAFLWAVEGRQKLQAEADRVGYKPKGKPGRPKRVKNDSDSGS